MSEQEQNKRINQHKRQIADLQQRVKTIELDVEPSGRISEGFDALEQHLDRVDNRLDRLERSQNEMNGKLDVILNHLTGLNDLPEE